MSKPLCDARKGLFTNKPPNGCSKPATDTWRVEKGWPQYLALRNVHPTTLLTEIKELLAGRFPANWNREELSLAENSYLTEKAAELAKKIPNPDDPLEEHLGRQDITLELIKEATYDKKLLTASRAKLKLSSNFAQLSGEQFLDWKKAFLKWEESPVPRSNPPCPNDFLEACSEEKSPPEESPKQSKKRKRENALEIKTEEISSETIEMLGKLWEGMPVLDDQGRKGKICKWMVASSIAQVDFEENGHSEKKNMSVLNLRLCPENLMTKSEVQSQKSWQKVIEKAKQKEQKSEKPQEENVQTLQDGPLLELKEGQSVCDERGRRCEIIRIWHNTNTADVAYSGNSEPILKPLSTLRPSKTRKIESSGPCSFSPP